MICELLVFDGVAEASQQECKAIFELVLDWYERSAGCCEAHCPDGIE